MYVYMYMNYTIVQELHHQNTRIIISRSLRPGIPYRKLVVNEVSDENANCSANLGIHHHTREKHYITESEVFQPADDPILHHIHKHTKHFLCTKINVFTAELRLNRKISIFYT